MRSLKHDISPSRKYNPYLVSDTVISETEEVLDWLKLMNSIPEAEYKNHMVGNISQLYSYETV